MPEILLEKASFFGSEWEKLADDYEKITSRKKKEEFINTEAFPMIQTLLGVQAGDVPTEGQKSTIDILKKSLLQWGFDERRNSCLIYIAGIRNGNLNLFIDKYSNHINYVLESILNKEKVYSKIPKELLYNKGLYERSFDDFVWALEELPVYYDQTYLIQTFDNYKEISTKEFYDNAGNLKSRDELEEIIRGWDSKEKGDDERGGDPLQDRKDFNLSNELVDGYEKLSTDDEKRNYLNKYVLPTREFKMLFGIRQIIVESILREGIDPRENQFLDFVLQIDFEMPDAQNYKNKMQYVFSSYMNDKLDLELDVLLNKSLYDRSDKEFIYTLNVFNMLSNPSTVSAYLKDTSVVKVSELMNGNVIKPAGIDKKPGDTIYNKIEEWASGNEYSQKEIADRNKADKGVKGGSTLGAVLKEKFQTYGYCGGLIEAHFSNSGVTIKKEDLLRMVYTAFVVPNIEDLYADTTPKFMFDVEQCSVSAINTGDKNHINGNQKGVAPGKLLHLPNAPDSPTVLYAFDKIALLEKDDKFVGYPIISQSSELQDVILETRVTITNKKDSAEVAKGVIRAFAEAYKNPTVTNALNSIWKENIV